VTDWPKRSPINLGDHVLKSFFCGSSDHVSCIIVVMHPQKGVTKQQKVKEKEIRIKGPGPVPPFISNSPRLHF